MTTENDEIAEAKAQRAKMLERLQWWELHRAEVLIPMAAGGFAVGFGVGFVLKTFAGLPMPVAFLMGVASLLLSGKYVDGYYSPAKLKTLDAKIERMVRKKK